jgi:putative ABC transport system permease protein
MVLCFVGISSGILQDFGRRVQGVGADVILQPSSASLLLSLSGAAMPIKIRDKILELKEVKRVSPVLVAVDTTNGFDMIYGIDYGSFNSLGQGFRFIRGAPPSASSVLIDDFKARSRDLDVGSRVHLLNAEFTVSGIVEHGRGARFFMPLSSLQKIMGADDKVTLFFVESRGDVPALLTEMKRVFAGYRILGVDEYASLMSASNFSELRISLNIIICLAAFISFLVILMTMYTSVLERVTEIGVRRVVGARRGDIMRQIVWETVALTLLGFAGGIAMTYLVKAGLSVAKPTFSILVHADWLLKTALIALVSSLLGAAYPAYRASRLDPARAVAYE